MISKELEYLLKGSNPWLWDPSIWDECIEKKLPHVFVPRILTARDLAFQDNKATVVIGPRQVGKSTLIWSHLKDIGPDILFVNCEEALMHQWCQSSTLFLQDVFALISKPKAIFFEEIQHLNEAGLFIKGLVDQHPGCPIYVTGSSAYHLMSHTRESLAGRALRQQLWPFSLEELTQDLKDEASFIRKSKAQNVILQMMVMGSYPEVWTHENKKDLLFHLFESVILKDASDLFRIDHPEAFRKLLSLMATQVGNLVNLAEWASHCGVTSKTISRYSSILEEAHIITLLKPWRTGKRSEITGRPKVFFNDNGIRNAALSRFSALNERDDKGLLWENLVFSELKKYIHPFLDRIGFWRTKGGAEVDFVLEKNEQIFGIEAKAGQTRYQLSRSIRSFIDTIHPNEFLIVHQGETHVKKYQECEIHWIALEDLKEKLNR